MKLYFAGYSTDKEIHVIKQANCLLESYVYFRRKNFLEWHRKHNLLGKDLFLDSGAFSAFTMGKVINIDDYIDFIKKVEPHVKVYAGLDVIGDWKESRKNQEYMESKGVKPLPTFHFRSPLHELERMCQKYKYIALGGLVPLSLQRDLLIIWLKKCFAITLKYNVKVHGFGVGNFNMWKMFPFYSVDATSWLMGGKFRRLVKFDGNKLKAYNKKSALTLELVKCHNWDYKMLNSQNVIEYQKAADYVTRLWEVRGVIYK